MKNTLPENGCFDISSDKSTDKKISLPGGGVFHYREFEVSSEKKGYIFLSSGLAPEIKGFNGPLELAVMADSSGNVMDFKILKNGETRAFLEKATQDKKGYLLNNIFSPYDENKIHAVSGATYSSKGISRTLWVCGNRFASLVLGKKELTEGKGIAASAEDVKGKLLFAIFILWSLAVLFLRLRMNRLLRFISLAVTFILFGLLFRFQYSSESVVSLLDFQVPPLFTISFALVFLIPAVLLLSGNFYCGYLCPFGALQELANNLNFTEKNLLPDKKTWRKIRITKYAVLLFLLFLFVFSGEDHRVFDGDILTGIFSVNFSNPFLIVLLGGILAVSLITPRFWCRNLCPAGAFLSIFNKANILKVFFGRKFFMKFFPVSPGYCDLGVSGFDENDCISCDRCRINRIEKGKIIMEQKQENGISKAGIIYSVLAAAFFILVIAASLYPFLKERCHAAHANAAYRDGTYQGQAKGYAGNIVCEVKIAGGKISDIKVVSSDENAPGASFTSIPAEIIKKQSSSVNAVSGATYSSKGVMGAVEQALAKASGKIKDGPPGKVSSAPLKFTASPQNCKDGDYIGIGKGTRQITVSVSLRAGKITNIKILDQQETMPGEAFVEIIPQIIEKQTLNGLAIPEYSGKTARGLLEAVNMALMIASESRKLESDIDTAFSSRAIKTIRLPPPDREGGMPLMKALDLRKSTRTFSSKPLPLQEISNLLWAAFGVNRSDKGRTAPSDMNMQETRIFLAMPDGLFIYDARANSMLQLSGEDIREHAGYQLFTQQAPLCLIYAADSRAMGIIKSGQERETAAMVDTAFISQNVYLYCSSAGLNTVVLGWFDKKKLQGLMGLDDNFILTYTQPVGYPSDRK